MIDTIRLLMKSRVDGPCYSDVLDQVKRNGYEVQESRSKSTFSGCYFVAPGGVLLPTGTITFWRSGIWSAETTLGSIQRYHNAHLFSFEEDEQALRQYLAVLSANLPVDIATARLVRVDVCYQWKVNGDYDLSLLPFFLSDFGLRRAFQVSRNGLSAKIIHSKYKSVKLYNKTIQIAYERCKSPVLAADLPDMPDHIIRLEVQYRGHVVLAMQNPVKPRKSRRRSSGALNNSGILTSRYNSIPPANEPIFNRQRIVEVLQHEWPGVYLAPAANATELISGHGGRGSVALVLHDRPYLRPDYRSAKGGNWSNEVKKLREMCVLGPPESLMDVPDLDDLEALFRHRTSPFYVQEVSSAFNGPTSLEPNGSPGEQAERKQ